MRCQRFICIRLSDPHMTCFATPFHHSVHHRGLSAEAAYGCLKSSPTGRLRRTFLHLSYSMTLARLLDTTCRATNPTLLPRRGRAATEPDLEKNSKLA